MEKIKGFIESNTGKDVLTIMIVILVGLGSFGLGRLSKESGQHGIDIEYLKNAPETPNLGQEQGASAINSQTVPNIAPEPKISPKATPAPKPAPGYYFASSRGNKYYHLGCTGGKTLKEENKIYFASEEEAIGAGYEKSTSCR